MVVWMETGQSKWKELECAVGHANYVNTLIFSDLFFSWATALQYFKLSFPSFYWWKPQATPSLLTLKVNAITRRKHSGYLLKHDNYSTACMCITMDFLYAESAETNSSHEFALCLGHFGQPLNLFELYSFNVISFHL